MENVFESKSSTTSELEIIKGIKDVPREEYYTAGHRTCQGCYSALIQRMIAKASGPRTIVLCSTSCMYVANTSYYSTPWRIPWMHTQLGSAGSAGMGTAAGLKALMRKGQIKEEKINIIAVCGDGGGADMGLSAISAALTHVDYNFLVILYDNESYANTGIQVSGTSPWGAMSTFSPSGTAQNIFHKRWKKNVAGMLAVGHPECRYVATACASYSVDLINKVRKALNAGGSTFIHVLAPCPKGWDYDPMLSHEIGKLAVETGIWVQFEVDEHRLILNDPSNAIAKGQTKRKPVREYLLKQGRFAHFGEDEINYFQKKTDAVWENWSVPGVIPFNRDE